MLYEKQVKNKDISQYGGETQNKSDDVRHQIAMVSGTEKFQNRDPLWHLDESFCQSFDLAGQKRAAGEEKRKEENSGSKGESGQLNDSITDFKSKYEPREGEREPEMGRFAEMAFKRGQLSSAVIAGTGKSMFFSCLNRTVGQQNAKNRKERKLFQKESLHRNVPGNEGAKLVVNRNTAESAVGLVVDSLKDARWTLKSMQDFAEGKLDDITGGAGAETYRKQYPFLTDKNEKELIENYKDKLAKTDSPKEKEALNAGIVKLQHIIEKKQQMKKLFLEHLKKLQYDALTAERMFLSEDFLRAAFPEEKQETGSRDEGGNDGGEDGRL